jgi:hypothetical protein
MFKMPCYDKLNIPAHYSNSLIYIYKLWFTILRLHTHTYTIKDISSDDHQLNDDEVELKKSIRQKITKIFGLDF